jgi:hypothetical protein
MPDKNGDEPVELKVIDRRKFTSEGDVRSDFETLKEDEPAVSAPEPSAPQPATAPSHPDSLAESTTSGAGHAPQSAPETTPAPDETSAKKPPEEPADGLRGGIQFEQLIMSLVSTAMLQLGLAARPGEVPASPDLPSAKETIDLIGILQEKTKGNLTLQEDKIFSGSLQELRMSFVELTKHSGKIH